MPYFWVQKKIHWSDTDTAGIAWFPNYFAWFEDAEEELYAAALGRSRQSLLDEIGFGLPRVEASAKYRAPVRAGQLIHVGIATTIENPRRLRYEFEMRDEASGTRLADGFVRVACVDLRTFAPRDFPKEVHQLVDALPRLAEQQGRDGSIPWT